MAGGSEHPVSGLVYQNAKSSWKCIVIPAVPGHVRDPEWPTCGDGFRVWWFRVQGPGLRVLNP